MEFLNELGNVIRLKITPIKGNTDSCTLVRKFDGIHIYMVSPTSSVDHIYTREEALHLYNALKEVLDGN